MTLAAKKELIGQRLDSLVKLVDALDGVGHAWEASFTKNEEAAQRSLVIALTETTEAFTIAGMATGNPSAGLSVAFVLTAILHTYAEQVIASLAQITIPGGASHDEHT